MHYLVLSKNLISFNKVLAHFLNSLIVKTYYCKKVVIIRSLNLSNDFYAIRVKIKS